MPTFETFAARLARCVDLFRDPGAKEGQKAQFRAVLGLLQDAAVTLRLHAGRLELNGVPCEGPGLAGLIERLDLHGISEIAVPQNPPAPELFELLQALADQPGADVPSRLRAAGAGRIRVTLASAEPPPAAATAPPEDLRARDPMTPSPGAPGDRPARSLGTDGILRGESWRDIPSVPIKGVPLVTHDPPPPPPATALPGQAMLPPPPTRETEELSLSAPQPPSAPSPLAPAPAAERAPPPLPQDVAGALAELERRPETPSVGDLLAVLTGHVETALRQNRLEQGLAIILAIARAEQRLPETSGVRRQYGIALKRIYTKPLLDGLARLVGAPKHRADAVAALQRAGGNAVEVLLDLLVAAPTVNERRTVFDALKNMREGTGQLVHLLDHPEWFVVRNAAELIGEIGVEDAVPALARKLDHKDERVRKAVALALAKIGTRSVAEPLRRALRDKSAEVRIQVALGIGGRKSSALAMPLVVAMEQEEDETVERELILALGRIGSPDAVLALIKFAQPAGRFFGRKPSGLRLAAIEALRLAATAPAVGTLEGLADDGDRQVRDAARAALHDLKRKPR